MPSKVPFIKNNICEKNLLFVGLSETWLKSHTNAELNINGYTIFRCDSTRKKKKRGRLTGGVCFYVREDFGAACEIIFSHSSNSVQLLCLYSKTENTAILLIYRQPDDSSNGNPSFPNDFVIPINRAKAKLSSLNPVPNIIFGGDFNLPHVSWPEGLPTSGCSNNERIMLNTLNEFCNDLFLTQYISSPTHKDGNILDLVFTNNESLIHECSIVPVLRSTSHHDIVLIQTSFKVENRSNEETPEKRTGFHAMNFYADSIEWNKIANALNCIDWDTELNNENPNIILQKFYDLCFNVCKDIVPTRLEQKTARKSHVKRYRFQLSKRRKKITKQLLKSKSVSRKTKIRSELLEIEKKMQKSFRDSETYIEMKAIKAIKRNPKYFFSYVQKKSKLKAKIGPLRNESGSLTCNSKEMAEILSTQYLKVFSNPNQHQCHMINHSTTTSEIKDMNLTEKDLIEAISELSTNAAAGPDGFPAILLKNCKNELAIPLCILWRKSLEKGLVPDDLKKSTITPIHKGESRSIPANYRPVALTSHLIKIFEKVMRNHLVKYMNDNKLFNPNQHGFRSGRSCLSQLLEQLDNILNILDENANADVIYLDFSKAFDKVDHMIVLQKIKSLGITGQILKWLQSFLFKRYQSVIVNGVKSEPQLVISGVPQGSVLGPLIFLILIGDIDHEIVNSTVHSFADDTRATKSIKTLEDVKFLQNDLNKIYDWTAKNNMELNDLKFELLRYGLNEDIKNQTNYKSPTGKIITSKDVVKDLGVLMSNDCSFKNHIDSTIEKAKNIISWILRSFSSRSRDVMLTLYKSLVIPILEYCSVLWDPSKVGHIQRLEAVQRSFLRKIAGTKKNYWECLQNLKVYSLQRRRERYQIIYMWKILENLVPNINNSIQSKDHPRLGRLCVSSFAENPKTSKLRKDTLLFKGVKLFNSLPKQIRGLKNITIEKFKKALDGHLQNIPDELQIIGYTGCRRADTNSLIHMSQLCCYPFYPRKMSTWGVIHNDLA